MTELRIGQVELGGCPDPDELCVVDVLPERVFNGLKVLGEPVGGKLDAMLEAIREVGHDDVP